MAGQTLMQSDRHCTAAFVRTQWEVFLGRPACVELLESAVSGQSERRVWIPSLVDQETWLAEPLRDAPLTGQLSRIIL